MTNPSWWPWRRKDAEQPPLLMASRTIYELDVPSEATEAGVVLAGITPDQWRALAAVADWLRLREAEGKMGHARTEADVALIAGQSQGMRLLLTKARDLVGASKKARVKEDAEHAAELLVSRGRSNLLDSV